MDHNTPLVATRTPAVIAGRIFIYGALLLFAAYFLVPLIVMILTSVKSMEDIRTGNLISLPARVTFEVEPNRITRSYHQICLNRPAVGLTNWKQPNNTKFQPNKSIRKAPANRRIFLSCRTIPRNARRGSPKLLPH